MNTAPEPNRSRSPKPNKMPIHCAGEEAMGCKFTPDIENEKYLDVDAQHRSGFEQVATALVGIVNVRPVPNPYPKT